MSVAGAGAGPELAPAGPVTPDSVALSATGLASLIKPIVLMLLAVLSGVAGWLAVQRGITSDDFPPFLADQQYTAITKYSGPWLTAAAGFALVAGLLMLAAVVVLTRRLRQSRRDDDARDR